MDKEFKNGKTATHMMVSGLMMLCKVRGVFFIKMEMYTLECGRRTSIMDKASLFIKMEPYTRVTGERG